MKIAVTITRSLIGLVFFAFGLMFFLVPFKMPAMTGKVLAFHTGLAATGYFFPFLKVVETVCGFFLLINRYTLLSLVVLAPITINILLYHTLMDTSGAPMAIAIIAIHIFLFYAYRKSYAGVLVSKAAL